MIVVKQKLLQFFAAVTRKLSISLSKEIQNKNKDLLEIANKKVKLMPEWYKCGKCRKLIEIRTMKFEHDKKYGRSTKCPYCKNKIYMQTIPKDLKHNENGSLDKEKPFPESGLEILNKKAGK